MDYLNKKLLSIPMFQWPATDKQICATNTRCHKKVYIKDKPYNFGYEHFVLSCDLGFAHRTEIYGGEEKE